MVSIESSMGARVDGPQGLEPPELTYRQKVIQALDTRISEHRFYTEKNVVFIGLATPIKKSRDNTGKNEPGTTPKEFYFEKTAEPERKESTPKSFSEELKTEQADRPGPQDWRTADEMSGGSSIVYREKGLGPRGGTITIERWSEYWQILGEYLGGEKSQKELAEKYKIHPNALGVMLDKIRTDLETKLYSRKKSIKNRRIYRIPIGTIQKPHHLLRLRKDLEDPSSQPSNLLRDLEKGASRTELHRIYGRETVSTFRIDLSNLGIGIRKNKRLA